MRQYIGARYVPRFSDVNNGIWSSVYSYEPLTIVKNGNDYYTSKQSVPVGIAITNTEYWVKTGDYNGAIGSLQSQINDMNDGSRAGSLQAQIDTINTRIPRPRSERKYILIGDSYAGGYTPDSTERKGWFYHFINDNGLTEGVNVFKSTVTGVGNSQFTLEGTELSFRNHIQNIVESVLPASGVNPLDITDIILLGGTNDMAYTSAQIIAGMESFFTYQKAHLPNAFVKIGVLCGFTDPAYNKQNNKIKVVTSYQTCGQYGAAYISNSEFICSNKSIFSSDGVHPSVAGYKLISKYTSSLIDASSVDVIYSEYTENLFTYSETFSGGTNAANILLHNNIITLDISTGSFANATFKTPLTLAQVVRIATVDIGKVNSSLIKGVGIAGYFGISCVAGLNANGTYMPSGLGTLHFLDGEAYLRMVVNIGDTTVRDYTQVTFTPQFIMQTLRQGF